MFQYNFLHHKREFLLQKDNEHISRRTGVTIFKEKSIPAVFHNNAEKFQDRPYASYRKDGVYTDISWKEMQEMVNNLSYYLLSKKIKKGDKVAVFANNRYEWHLAALAITSIGAVDVPIYSTNSPEESKYVLTNSDAKFCFAGSKEQLENVLSIKKSTPKVKEYVVFDKVKSKDSSVQQLDAVLKEGKKNPNDKMVAKRIEAIEKDDLCTLIYTSGTTGNPKGVMLTHNNFYSNVKNTYAEMKNKDTGESLITEEDTFLSFLPLSHSLERTAGFHGAVYKGCKTAFAVDIKTILEDFVDVRPTVIICVPRIYEKIHAAVLGKVALASPIKKAIFGFAASQAKKNLPNACKDLPPTGFLYGLADKLVFSKLKVTLGMDRLRYAISGGAPLSVSDAEFFIGMGLKILEGFGLTETSPITTFNRPWDMRPGTVGTVIPDTEIKISDEGELLIKGPQIMAGYYKNEAATKEVTAKGKFFRTGDIAVIDEEGFLRITGRIKDIIVTAGGKNISPQNIENSVKDSQFVEQIAIIGDKRKFLSALIVPAFAELEAFAQQEGIEFGDVTELLTNSKVLDLFRKEIDAKTTQFARVEQIRKFTLIKAEWTQETGELTPTQKIKRKSVTEIYTNEIEAMYKDED